MKPAYIFKNRRVESERFNVCFEYLLISKCGKVTERFACPPAMAKDCMERHDLVGVSFADCRRMGVF